MCFHPCEKIFFKKHENKFFKSNQQLCLHIPKFDLMAQTRDCVCSEKKHVCEYCGKNFLQKSAWRDHVKSWHTEDKPYRCCKCNYSSVDATALRTHMKTCIQHEFLCPVRPLCNYSFSSSNALEKHIIMHTGNVSLFQKQ